MTLPGIGLAFCGPPQRTGVRHSAPPATSKAANIAKLPELLTQTRGTY